MYVPDNLDQFNAYSEQQETALAKLPECSECGQPIQDEFCFEINDELICNRCMRDNHRKAVDDFVE